MIYLDYNATVPIRPESTASMQALLPFPLNPSSVHGLGREAKKHLENSRKTIAEAISVWPNEIIFCSSGTEANNWALRSQHGRRILVSAVEHSSIIRGGDILLPVTANGIIDLTSLEACSKTLAGRTLVAAEVVSTEVGISFT